MKFNVPFLFLLLMLPVFGNSNEIRLRKLDNRCGGFYMADKSDEFDTGILNIPLSENPQKTAKMKFWEALREKQKNGKLKPYIYRLTFIRPEDWKTSCPEWTQRLPPFEIAKRQIDLWFRSDENCKTSPELLYAVVPMEENIQWAGQLEIMNQIYDHIQKEYGIPVYQWLSEPLPPNPKIRADGWIMDAYHRTTPMFHALLEAFVIDGKPVVPVIWGSGHFGGFHKEMNFEQLKTFTRERMDICRALNLPVILFAVAQKPYGSAWAWFTEAETPEEQSYRTFLRNYLLNMKNTPAPEISFPEKEPFLLIPHRDGTGSETLPRSNIRISAFLTENTTLDSPYNWRLTMEGLMLTAPEGTLSWKLNANQLIDEAEVILEYSLEDGNGTLNSIRLAPEAKKCSLHLQNFKEQAIRLKANGKFKLFGLEIRFKGKFTQEVLKLRETGKGIFRSSAGFEDGMFEKSVVDVISKHGDPPVEFTRAGLQQKGCPAAPAESIVTQAVELPGCAGTLTVKGSLHTYWLNKASIHGYISTDGKTPLAEVTGMPQKTKYQPIQMSAVIPDGTKRLFITWILKIDKPGGTALYAPAVVRNYEIEFIR